MRYAGSGFHHTGKLFEKEKEKRKKNEEEKNVPKIENRSIYIM